MQSTMGDTPSQAPARPPETTQVARFRALLAADPSNERLRTQCARLAAEARDFDALLELARQRLRAAPADAEALFHEATALLGLRRVDEALRPLEALEAALPSDAAVLSNLGLCRYAQGDYAAARGPLERAYAAGERSADLLRLLASTYHHVGEIEKAVEIATANVDAARDNGALAGVFALAFLDGDDPARAARCAAFALKENPQSIDGLIVQGTLRLGQLETAEAVQQFANVAALAPDNARAWIGLGTAALLKQDLPTAKTALRRGLDHMPGHVGSWHVLAWTELMSGEIAEARRLFERSLELDRNFSESHGGLAAVAALSGDRATAQREIEVANRLDPECLSAKFAESVLARAAGDAEGARKLVQSTIAGMTDQPKSPLAEYLASLARR
jgi:tetratricopeptide (TPR) repeat protein